MRSWRQSSSRTLNESRWDLRPITIHVSDIPPIRPVRDSKLATPKRVDNEQCGITRTLLETRLNRFVVHLQRVRPCLLGRARSALAGVEIGSTPACHSSSFHNDR